MSAGAWLRITQSLTLFRVPNNTTAFQQLGGVSGSKGFPEQFDSVKQVPPVYRANSVLICVHLVCTGRNGSCDGGGSKWLDAGTLGSVGGHVNSDAPRGLSGTSVRLVQPHLYTLGAGEVSMRRTGQR